MGTYFWDCQGLKTLLAQFLHVHHRTESEDGVNQSTADTEPCSGPVVRAVGSWLLGLRLVSGLVSAVLFHIKSTVSTVLHDSDWEVCVHGRTAAVMTLNVRTR